MARHHVFDWAHRPPVCAIISLPRNNYLRNGSILSVARTTAYLLRANSLFCRTTWLICTPRIPGGRNQPSSVVSISKSSRHSPGTLGTRFAGAPDTIRTCDLCLRREWMKHRARLLQGRAQLTAKSSRHLHYQSEVKIPLFKGLKVQSSPSS